MIAPANSPGSSKPSSVIAGSSALRSACLNSTTRSFKPLARAVRMKSRRITSSMFVRKYRVSDPTLSSVSTVTGKII
ncbi:hypothetical protein D3C85_1770560 [compost metagenome]